MCRKNLKSGGYSLIEVVLAMAIFGMLALVLTRGLTFARAVSETNIREVTASAVASGYLEQIKSMEYWRIQESVRDNTVPLPTVLNLGTPDPIYLNAWTTKNVVIDQDPVSGEERTMPFHIRIEIDDLKPSGEGEILGITEFFAWEDAKTHKRHERALRTMRSHVPTF